MLSHTTTAYKYKQNTFNFKFTHAYQLQTLSFISFVPSTFLFNINDITLSCKNNIVFCFSVSSHSSMYFFSQFFPNVNAIAHISITKFYTSYRAPDVDTKQSQLKPFFSMTPVPAHNKSKNFHSFLSKQIHVYH